MKSKILLALAITFAILGVASFGFNLYTFKNPIFDQEEKVVILVNTNSVEPLNQMVPPNMKALFLDGEEYSIKLIKDQSFFEGFKFSKIYIGFVFSDVYLIGICPETKTAMAFRPFDLDIVKSFSYSFNEGKISFVYVFVPELITFSLFSLPLVFFGTAVWLRAKQRKE